MTEYSSGVLEAAKSLGTSTLFEASGLVTCALLPKVKSVWRGAVVAGPAYPVDCARGDNLGIHIAMERAPGGSVLVVNAEHVAAGFWGEVLTVAAEYSGLVALVISGGVRDVAAIRRRNFPVFSSSVAIEGTPKQNVVSVGQPILIDATPVAKGDLVVADDDGVVVLPRSKVNDILRRAEMREVKEREMMGLLEQGKSTLELLGLTAWREYP